MQENLLKKMEVKITELSKAQRRVANYIIGNPMEAAFSTVEQIAHRVDVSTTTIVRLANSMDLPGYADLQRELQETLKRQADPSTKLELNIADGNRDGELVREILRQQVESISITCENLDTDSIQKLARQLSSAKNIYIFGSRSCFGVAHYLYYDLNRIFGNCHLLSDLGGTLPEQAASIGEGDVYIAITMPRYVKAVVDVTAYAKSKGAVVASITDNLLSPMVDHSDIVLMANCKSKGYHNALTTSMLIADTLICMCTGMNSERTKKQLESTKEISSILKTSFI